MDPVAVHRLDQAERHLVVVRWLEHFGLDALGDLLRRSWLKRFREVTTVAVVTLRVLSGVDLLQSAL
ncbi:MAG: hypothetical protein QOJ13_2332 [Gaiellales bacterium]|jgi:hypothetical protein|nr:hypothetical protein [Gaiellales bacterium]